MKIFGKYKMFFLLTLAFVFLLGMTTEIVVAKSPIEDYMSGKLPDLDEYQGVEGLKSRLEASGKITTILIILTLLVAKLRSIIGKVAKIHIALGILALIVPLKNGFAFVASEYAKGSIVPLIGSLGVLLLLYVLGTGILLQRQKLSATSSIGISEETDPQVKKLSLAHQYGALVVLGVTILHVVLLKIFPVLQ